MGPDACPDEIGRQTRGGSEAPDVPRQHPYAPLAVEGRNAGDHDL
jgi:hypothetical protein